MEEMNSRLYVENWRIMQENEILRKAAELLSEENQALVNEINQRLAAAAGNTSTSTSTTTTTTTTSKKRSNK